MIGELLKEHSAPEKPVKRWNLSEHSTRETETVGEKNHFAGYSLDIQSIDYRQA